MGQRSQIYVFVDGVPVLARYFGWNYGERMISRARALIEHLDYIKEYDFIRRGIISRTGTEHEKLKRFADVNFDMRDIQVSQDIFEEARDYGMEQISPENYAMFVYYDQDNNDGKLFISLEKDKIKYAFTDYNTEEPMTAGQYAIWDSACEAKAVKEKGKVRYTVDTLDEEDIQVLNENIEEIEKYTLMSDTELEGLIRNAGAYLCFHPSTKQEKIS